LSSYNKLGISRGKKGQLTVDMIITIIFLGLLAVILFSQFIEEQDVAFEIMDKLSLDDIADMLEDKIAGVSVMGDGANVPLNLPARSLTGIEYNLTIIGNSALIRSGNDSANAYARFATDAWEMPTPIHLEPGEYLIKNTNGLLSFTKTL